MNFHPPRALTPAELNRFWSLAIATLVLLAAPVAVSFASFFYSERNSGTGLVYLAAFLLAYGWPMAGCTALLSMWVYFPRLAKPTKLIAIAVGLALLFFGGRSFLADTEPTFGPSPAEASRWVASFPEGVIMSGTMRATYMATGSASECSRVPRVFGIIPQHSAMPLMRSLVLAPLESAPTRLAFTALTPEESRCRWRFVRFSPQLQVNGLEAMGLEGSIPRFKSPAQRELTCVPLRPSIRLKVDPFMSCDERHNGSKTGHPVRVEVFRDVKRTGGIALPDWPDEK